MTAERISLELVTVPGPTRGIGRRLWAKFVAWRKREEQRRVLAGFDERMLRDLGLTQADVARELDSPRW